MKRCVVSLTILFFWLASGFGFSAMTETIASSAGEGGTQNSVASETSASSHLSGPTTGPDGISFQVQANAQSLSPDRDYDGLTDDVEENGWENAVGFFITDPLDPDSDDDGLTDGQEKLFDTDPLDDTSPGIYVEYSNELKTSKYFPWERHGSKFITLNSAVVRRGATFYVGGPSDATIKIGPSWLTSLPWQRDVCAGRWRITVPIWGTVGKYAVTLEKGAWSQSLNLYVIFELPTNMSDADVAAYVYSDAPNFRDEYVIWFCTSEPDDSWDLWPPYHHTTGRGYAFQTDQYQAYVFEDHIIEAINGHTDPWDATNALGYHLDGILRFEVLSLWFNMWSTLHAWNQQAQCSTHACAMASFARGAGIPARPVVYDYDMNWATYPFDHSTEVWLSGDWRVMRAWRCFDETSPGAPIACGILLLTNRNNWPRYNDSGGDIIAVADSNWVWEHMDTDWSDPNQFDYLFGNYDNGQIVRWDWVNTEVIPYGWGWGQEPVDIGEPYKTWLPWPSVPPTPAVIVHISGNGRVTKDPDQSPYEYGEVVTLEAFPDPGWSFAEWSGDLSGTDNPETITITKVDDVIVTATFTEGGYTLTVNVDPSGSGSVDVEPPGPYHYGDDVKLTANPATGWDFDRWSGDLRGKKNPETIRMDGNKTVTANFTPSRGNLGSMSAPASTPTPTATAINGSTFVPASQNGGDTGLTSASPNAEATPYVPVTLTGTQDKVVQLGQVVADYGVDLNGNGRFDQLVIEVEVNATQPGYYSMGGLLDSAEFTTYANIPALASAATYTYLEAGSQTVQLAFDGRSISLARVDGPYEVKGLWISDLGLDSDPMDLAINALDRKDPAYTTAAYQASDFETLGATITDQYTERGEDNDRDGRYESLTIDVGWAFQTPGTYKVVGDLYDRQGQLISQATWSGSHSPASLQFDEIRGTVGPYTLRNLYLLNANDEIVDSRDQAYTTQQVMEAEGKTHIVDEADFGEIEAKAILPDTYSDSGLDLDGDGLYDLLVINVQVEVEAAGQYRLEGWLEGEDGSLISWASSDPVALTVGTHSLSLAFSGPAIHAHNTDGPFTLMALKLLKGSGYEVLDEVDVAYTTSAYTHDQFESRPHLELPADHVILFEDHLENGEGNWTADWPWALITAQFYSPTHSWTDSPNENYTNGRNVSLTTVPINLWEFSRPTLQFQTCYDLETDFDYGHVDISTDEGATWTNVAAYTGRTGHWSGKLVDLGVIFGAETLRVRFRLETDTSATADGWYIDDVAVYFDDDLDDDGIPNDVEVGEDPTNPIDTDGDGTPDYLDPTLYIYFPLIFK